MYLQFTLAGYLITLNYYFLIGAAIVMITTWASIYHKTYTPAVWGWIIGAGIYYYQQEIASIMLNWTGTPMGILYYLSLALFLTWGLLIIILIMNTIKKGEVVL